MVDDWLVYPELSITTERCCVAFADAVAEGDWDGAVSCIVDAVEFRNANAKRLPLKSVTPDT